MKDEVTYKIVDGRLYKISTTICTRIYDILKNHKYPLTQREIGAISGINRANISEELYKLIFLGFVIEGKKKRGRKTFIKVYTDSFGKLKEKGD